MDLQLTDKRAIVLGGTRGIGRAIVETLLDEGAAVSFCARNDDGVAEAKRELAPRGTVHGQAVDIADHGALKAYVGAAASALGGIDILISNASALAMGADAATFRKCLDIDVLGALAAFEAAEPHLAEAAKTRGDASFLAIASVSAAAARAPDAYGAIKAALIHAVTGLAKAHAGRHIRANVVSPGTIYFKGGVWNVIEEANPAMFKGAIASNPLGRMGTPQEIADMAVFLSSPRSRFTTGSNVVVDGAILNRVNF